MVKSQFTRSLTGTGFFSQRPFVVVDVGALGGFNPRWTAFAPDCRMIGFEPQEAKQEAAGRTTYPVALGRSREVRTLHITRNPALSSFLPIQESWRRRSWVFNEMGDQVRTVALETIGLDDFVAENQIDYVDFVKIDTEGTELEVLTGAERLVNTSVLGIECEVFFHETHQGRCLFSDLDTFLRRHGFVLFDLKPWRFSKTALPNLEPSRHGISPYGQVVGGDVLYLRDLAADDGANDWVTAVEVGKLACLMELWDLPDCAIELLDWAAGHGKTSAELQLGPLRDTLAPTVLGRMVSVEFYRQMAGIFR